MRYGIISDIHANLAALQAVLAHLGSVDALWCLGDIVGYGPDPNECVEIVQRQASLCIPGNHDWASSGKIGTEDFNDDAAQTCLWTRQQLSPPNRDFLANLAETRQEGDFTLAHGSPGNPIWEYLLSVGNARESFGDFQSRFCLVGHTHVPLAFTLEDSDGRQGCRGALLAPDVPLELEEGTRLIYNPGGVGQPRDGDPRAAYALYDGEAQTITHHRVPYDIAATQQRMTAAGLPQYLVERLAIGR